MTKKKSFEYSFDLQQPGYGQSLENILQNAVRLHQQGNLALAEKYYQQILKAQPKHAYTLNLLGALYSQKGEHTKGEKLIKKAIAIDSSVPDYHSNLGLALQHQGKMAEAKGSFLQATRLDSGFIPGWVGVGNACVNLRDLDTAIEAFQTVIKIQPDCFPAYNNLGNAYRKLQMYSEAHKMYEKAMELKPDFTEGWYNIGMLYKQEKKGEQAISAFDKAISLRPDYLAAITKRADVRRFVLNDFEGALQDIEYLVKANPDFIIAFYIWKSELFIEQGSLDKAEAMLKKSLELNKAPVNRVFDVTEDDQFQSITSKIDRNTFWLEKSVRLLGDIAHLQKNYDNAFTRYSEANAIMARYVEYDRAAHEKIIDALISFFTPEFFAEFSNLGTAIELPVIITGMPRSGKTLTEQIIARHPGVAAAGEVSYFTGLTPRMTSLFESDQAWPNCCKSLNRKIADKLIGEYLGILRSYGNSARLVIDTSPGNYLHLGVIRSLFPKAPFIHCRRNPLDMCLEIYFKGFKNYEFHRYSYNLLDIAHYYQQSLRLMEHWRKVLPGSIMESRYEDLTENYTDQGRKLMDFCGLEKISGDSGLVSGDITWDRSRRGPQPVNRSFVDFSKHYDKYLGPLREFFADAGVEV